MSKQRVLGSADDNIACFLHMPFFIDLFFLIMNMLFGQIPANSAYLYLQYDVAFFLHIMICFIGHG